MGEVCSLLGPNNCHYLNSNSLLPNTWGLLTSVTRDSFKNGWPKHISNEDHFPNLRPIRYSYLALTVLGYIPGINFYSGLVRVTLGVGLKIFSKSFSPINELDHTGNAQIVRGLIEMMSFVGICINCVLDVLHTWSKYYHPSKMGGPHDDNHNRSEPLSHFRSILGTSDQEKCLPYFANTWGINSIHMKSLSFMPQRLKLAMKVSFFVLDILGYIPGISFFSGMTRVSLSLILSIPFTRMHNWPEYHYTLNGQIVRGILEMIPLYGINGILDTLHTPLNLKNGWYFKTGAASETPISHQSLHEAQAA